MTREEAIRAVQDAERQILAAPIGAQGLQSMFPDWRPSEDEPSIYELLARIAGALERIEDEIKSRH